VSDGFGSIGPHLCSTQQKEKNQRQQAERHRQYAKPQQHRPKFEERSRSEIECNPH
jgi:hypothetical protein